MLIFNLVFYISAALLATLCIFTANNMSSGTCGRMKACLLMIVVGMVGIVMATFYDLPKELSMACALPIVWGITGWLLFDRYRAYTEIDQFMEWVIDQIYKVKTCWGVIKKSVVRR